MAGSPFMRRALDEAARSLEDDVGGPFGAVVVRDGEILAVGRNRVLADHDPTAHAEVVALRRAADALGSHVLDGCTIYTTCEPCPMCLSAIYWSRIDRIVQAASREDAAGVGFDDSFLYAEVARPLAERKIPVTSEGTADAVSVMRAWADRPGRTLY